uniref:C2H2-type domain-containing protein n=1 Tax=Lutzomyia longipalpis TaxID=7200 RepID=A0A1B0CUQ7_LUTLO
MGSLTRHLRSHSGQQRMKKHLCTVCGKGDLNPLIVQEIDINTGEEATGQDRKSNIVNFQVQGIPEDGNRQCSSQLSSESSETTTKYIVSNVIQVPFFINSSDCQNVDEII